jgi:HSP20 family protein
MTPQGATAMQPVKTTAVTRRADPLDTLHRMQKLNEAIERRAFEIFDNHGRWFGRELSDWLEAEAEMLHPVHLEITEADGAFNVQAEVPGFTAKELDIQVEPRRLTISGKHEAREENKKGKTVYCEQCANEILRSVELPTEVDQTKVTATLKDGILNIELPKTGTSKSVRVEPKTFS